MAFFFFPFNHIALPFHYWFRKLAGEKNLPCTHIKTGKSEEDGSITRHSEHQQAFSDGVLLQTQRGSLPIPAWCNWVAEEPQTTWVSSASCWAMEERKGTEPHLFSSPIFSSPSCLSFLCKDWIRKATAGSQAMEKLRMKCWQGALLEIKFCPILCTILVSHIRE